MVELLIATRRDGKLKRIITLSLDDLEEGVPARLPDRIEDMLYQLLPKTDYLLLLGGMNRRVEDMSLNSLLSSMNRERRPKGVAALVHYADGTEEAVTLHDDGEYDLSLAELFSAVRLGLEEEDCDSREEPK